MRNTTTLILAIIGIAACASCYYLSGSSMHENTLLAAGDTIERVEIKNPDGSITIKLVRKPKAPTNIIIEEPAPRAITDERPPVVQPRTKNLWVRLYLDNTWTPSQLTPILQEMTIPFGDDNDIYVAKNAAGKQVILGIRVKANGDYQAYQKIAGTNTKTPGAILSKGTSYTTEYPDQGRKTGFYLSVQVEAPTSANILLRSAATQSSSSEADGRAEAVKAVDGLTGTCKWFAGLPTTTNTLSLTSPGTTGNTAWWLAAIPNVKFVKQVKVYDREDLNHKGSLVAYTVRVGNDAVAKNNPQCPGTYTSSQTVQCNIFGRYVGIVQTTLKPLGLCEVEAFEQ